VPFTISPVSATVSGLVALSVMLSVAVRIPIAVGEKITLMVQLAPAATLPPQLSVRVNSDAFVPLTEILVILSTVDSLFANVMV
jgi:hypothetical protein